MDMDVDQAGQDRLARGFDRLRLQRLRLGRGAFINFRDLPSANQDRA